MAQSAIAEGGFNVTLAKIERLRTAPFELDEATEDRPLIDGGATRADLEKARRQADAEGRLVDFELIFGRLWMTRGAQSDAHSWAITHLRDALGETPYFYTRGGSWYFRVQMPWVSEGERGEGHVVPDLLGYRKNADLPWPPGNASIPDFVCEVLSKGTEDRDRNEKRTLCLSQGVEHYWLIDPEQHTLTAYRLPAYRLTDAGYVDNLEGEVEGEVVAELEPSDRIQCAPFDEWPVLERLSDLWPGTYAGPAVRAPNEGWAQRFLSLFKR